MLIDPFGRRIDYLRLSVTDHCNLRCVYCLPARGFPGSRPAELLTDGEIVRLASVAAGLGISKIRVTGGEPLLRPGIAGLVRRLAQIPGIQDLSLSTNGVLLGGLARGLREAGLRRVNVSVDTLRPDRFRAVTRHGRLSDVLEGLEAALEAGMTPVKINVVVMKGINADEIPDFVALVRSRPVHVRFIELMPIGETGFFKPERWVPLPEIRALCGPLDPVPPDDRPRGHGPAAYFKPRGTLGTVGFIGALSCNFCGRCNRLRLTSRGELFPCLASSIGLDLREPLRSGAQEREIAALFQEAVRVKPERHEMESSIGAARESFMCSLGG